MAARYRVCIHAVVIAQGDGDAVSARREVKCTDEGRKFPNAGIALVLKHEGTNSHLCVAISCRKGTYVFGKGAKLVDRRTVTRRESS